MRGLIVAIIGLGLAASARAGEPEGPAARPDAESVQTLLGRLADRDFRTREAAQRAIETRGLAALPELRKFLAADPPAEARKRVAAIVETLERQQLLAPTRITLSVQDRPVAEVIREIARQTGYRMQCQVNNLTVTAELTNAPFWEAIDTVCNTAGLVMYHNEGQGMVFYQQDSFWPHVHYQGPFKIVANNFNYNKTFNFGPIQRNPMNNPLRSESLTFSFTLYSEAKLPLMSAGMPRLYEATDDRGGSMIPETNPHESNYPPHYNGYRTYQIGTSVNLSWPDKESRTVRRLRGIIPVTLLGDQKPEVMIEDILKAKDKKLTGPTVEIHLLDVKEQNKSQYHIKLSVRNLAPNAANDYSWTNSVHQRMELLDEKGNKYSAQGYNWENSSPAHVQATFSFGNAGNATLGPPVRLVYNRWMLMQHSIEFDFKNLNLP